MALLKFPLTGWMLHYTNLVFAPPLPSVRCSFVCSHRHMTNKLWLETVSLQPLRDLDPWARLQIVWKTRVVDSRVNMSSLLYPVYCTFLFFVFRVNRVALQLCSRQRQGRKQSDRSVARCRCHLRRAVRCLRFKYTLYRLERFIF